MIEHTDQVNDLPRRPALPATRAHVNRLAVVASWSDLWTVDHVTVISTCHAGLLDRSAG